jgi:hypothetical protein
VLTVLAYFAGVSRTKKQVRDKRRQADQLGNFLLQAQDIRKRLDENPLPIADRDAWVARVTLYLRTDLGTAYDRRFRDFSGITFFGDGSPRSQMRNSLEGYSQRLHEFINELEQ